MPKQTHQQKEEKPSLPKFNKKFLKMHSRKDEYSTIDLQKSNKPETPNLKDFAIKETYDAINAKIESA